MITFLLAILLQDRVLPEGRKPADVRLEPLKNLDGTFPVEVPPTKAAWEARAAELKLRTRCWALSFSTWRRTSPNPATSKKSCGAGSRA